MTLLTTAQPETYVVSITSGSVVKMPVVAWLTDAENNYAAPCALTVKGIASMKGKAILHPCGMVSDPSQLLAFGSIDEWKKIAGKGPVEQDEPTPEETAGVELADDEKPSASGLEIEWTTKPFKNNSFYLYKDEEAEVEFVFQVPGDNNPPKQTGPVTKIKRDEFMAFKKEMDVADYEELLEGRYPGMTDLGAFGEEDEDDDGTDLI